MAIFNLLHYKLPNNFDKKVVFDTNIWLLLYSELHQTKEREIAAYSNFFDQIIEQDIEIIITSNIISEISNVLLRADFNSKSDVNGWGNFKKDYVGNEHYQEKVSEINSIIESILLTDNIIKIDDGFSDLDVENVNDKFKLVDWNDAYLYELSKKNNFTILSHDRDFKKLDFTLIDLIQLF